MLKQTQLLKAKLEESRRNGYKTNISRLRPGQECIMVIRPWEIEKKIAGKCEPRNNRKATGQNLRVLENLCKRVVETAVQQSILK